MTATAYRTPYELLAPPLQERIDGARDRANHTGLQAIGTIDGLPIRLEQVAFDTKADAAAYSPAVAPERIFCHFLD